MTEGPAKPRWWCWGRRHTEKRTYQRKGSAASKAIRRKKLGMLEEQKEDQWNCSVIGGGGGVMGSHYLILSKRI